jgi:transposase InsO family protein
MIAVAFEERNRLPLSRLARLFRFSRTEFYRETTEDRDRLLRDAIHAIALDWPCYGYRTITHELRRHGWRVNEKRIRRLMHEEGLVRRTSKRRGLKYRKHNHTPYPNLTRNLVPQRINQLWVADFTYVHFHGRFIFVAFILDAYSRRSLGWSIAPHFRTELIIGALRMALANRVPTAGFIHHSDRGGEYFDTEYLALLRDHGAQISMSRAATPSDNPKIERFIRTIKDEEVYLRDYVDFDEAARSIARFIHKYNNRRLHSKLGYRPPEEFERICGQPKLPTPA